MDRLLVAAFEGTSRIAGIALGALRLLTAMREIAPHAPELEKARVMRELTKSSAMWCRKQLGLAETARFELMLGGEHLVTFPMLEVLVKRHPGLRLVVLDAHHDAYVHPLLTHWSLFHFAIRELEIPTLIVGARHELDKADSDCRVISADTFRELGVERTLARIAEHTEGAPFYFSLDVDVVDPTELAAVSDPVHGGLSVNEVTQLARGILARDPVAADVVEYNALRDPDGEALRRLHPLLEEYAKWFL